MKSTKLSKALVDIKVAYLGDQFSSFTARILHDLGAQVTKYVTDSHKPAAHEDHYLAGIDVEVLPAAAPSDFESLLQNSDIVINSCPEGKWWPVLSAQEVQKLHEVNPRQIIASITPYGMTGPWAGRPASDLTLLAAGGFLGSCGYDNGDEAGLPMGSTGGQVNHVTGMISAIAIISELVALQSAATHSTEPLDISAQHALAVSTEMAIPYWDYTNREVIRHTGRHAMPVETAPWQHKSADGKYFLALPLYVTDARYQSFRQWMRDEGLGEFVEDDRLEDNDYRNQNQKDMVDQFRELVNRRNSGWLFTESQRRRLPWAPINTADECIQDSHFSEHRTTIEEISGIRRARLPFLISGVEAGS